MKRKGKHPHKELTAVQIKAAKEPGRYPDGNGLYLVVDPSGAKRWVLRTVVQGTRRDIGLGGTSIVSLADARERAASFRKIARDGGDPIAERDKAQLKKQTFEQVARKVHEIYKPSWKNAKHADQWINTLEDYVFPKIGNIWIDKVSTPEILNVLSPIWLSKPETAKRVKQRIGVIMDWAHTQHLRSGENPVRSVTKGLPKQRKVDNHHEALPYDDVPAFITRLRESNSDILVKLAFEFLILTAVRTTEVRLVPWSEIDIEERVWTIPLERMKMLRVHRVPLSTRCIEILKETRKVSNDNKYVFPGHSLNKPLSDQAFLMVMRRMGYEATPHGFRSSFRDWAAEQTNFPHDVCEAALSHTIKNKAEAAYKRTDLFDKRRELMDSWATFATSKKVKNCASRKIKDAR